MDDQGGAGGAPLHHDEGEARRRKPHVEQQAKEGRATGGEPHGRRSEHDDERGHVRGGEGDGERKTPAKGPE